MIVTVPVLSPRLSSLWVGLVTPLPADLALLGQIHVEQGQAHDLFLAVAGHLASTAVGQRYPTGPIDHQNAVGRLLHKGPEMPLGFGQREEDRVQAEQIRGDESSRAVAGLAPWPGASRTVSPAASRLHRERSDGRLPPGGLARTPRPHPGSRIRASPRNRHTDTFDHGRSAMLHGHATIHRV